MSDVQGAVAYLRVAGQLEKEPYHQYGRNGRYEKIFQVISRLKIAYKDAPFFVLIHKVSGFRTIGIFHNYIQNLYFSLPKSCFFSVATV